ncbi:MAG: AAA domain-containing protein, partial [Bacilli bacterium]
PPGTGKSQTITNIIAEALFDGKKVLFVSEKMAALNVVYKKLTAAGLGSFCLELHSRKCNKKLVAQEILNTLNQNHIALLETANEKVADYNYYRSYLNQYDQELNRKIKGIDLSPYELMGRGDKYQVAQDVNFYFPDIASTDQTYLDKALDNLKKYLYLVKIVGTNYLSNPLINYVSSDSYADTACFKEKTQEARDSLLKLISSNYDFLIKEFSLTEIPLHDLKDMIKALLQVQKVSTYSGLITSSDKRTAIQKEVKDYLALKKEKEDFDSKLEKHIQKPYYHDPKLQVKSIDFITKYQNPFLRLSKDYRQIKQAFKARKFKTSKANYKEMCVAFQSLEDYLNKEDLLTTGRKSLLHHLDAYQDDDQEFSSLQKDLSLLSRITSPSVLKYLSNLSEPSFLFLQSSNQLESYPLTSIDNLNAYGQFFKEGYLSEENLNAIHQDIDIIQSTIDKLSSFCQLQATINEAKKDKYDAFISAYLPFLQKEDLTKSGLIDSFKKVFYCQWSDYALKNNPFLSQVSSFKHGEIAKNFIQSDKEKMKINSFDIQRAVFSRYPNMTDHSYGTIGKLKMDVSKKKGLLSIRSLLSQYREEIQQIKPCFLISPLSVSTLLDSTEHFDLVVFDEASQVFPWDALGAIYRSSQAIISGDQHQMPPTSFFLTRIDEIDEEDDVSLNQSNASDFESILDYFAAFPHYELLWHYRSRCEQLISFSNHHFYNDNLVTFPSAKKSCPGFGVDFEYVDNGVYDRKERNNPIEAQRVVDLVYDCYQNRRSKSVGVVAFNISQQDEISDGIDKLADNDPDFAKYINGDKTEPLFVKNLETVQGNERDIIILSIGYAKDSKGTFILNFGPLNKEGGERRLNVAITRAKENVIVCSSIRCSDIDLSRSYSFGTRFLHDYLYFAQTKRQNDMPSPFDAKLEFDSPFEEDVYNFLVSKQYGVDTQVGCSGYRIDMGVKNRTNSDYVLAIECDGKTYHSGKCARDRDRLRQEVLEEKGWKFYRIWSTDWFKDRRNSEENLVLAIERALKNETLKEEIIPSQKASDAIPVLAIPIAPTEKRLKDYFPKYVPYNKVLNSKGTNYSYSSIQRFLEDVVDKEQPITEKLLLRRLATYLNR